MTQPTPRRQTVLALVGLGLAYALALAFGLRSAELERSRDIAALGQQHALVAASRAEAVSGWVQETRDQLAALADNPAVRLYTLGASSSGDPRAAAGQAQYLESLLNATAARAGFGVARIAVRADVPVPEAPGIAVLDPAGRLIARAGGPLPRLAQGFDAHKPRLSVAMLGGQAALSATQPILRLQDDTGAPVGLLYAVRLLDEGLARRLRQPGDPYASGRTILVDARGTPLLAPGTEDPAQALPEAIRKALPRDGKPWISADSTAAYQPLAIGGLGVVRVVDADEALQEANERRRLKSLGWISGISWLAAVLLLLWRHGAAQRATSAARDAEAATAREGRARLFLQEIADRQQALILVGDADDQLEFSNARARVALHLGQDARGVPLASLFGAEAETVAGLLAALRATASAAGPARLSLGGRSVSLSALPMADGQSLLVGDDVTDVLAAEARRAAAMTALVTLLTGLIDARDPASTAHSLKVSRLAVLVGTALGLSEAERATLQLAGQLMNLGKMLVPAEILTKAGPLDAQEQSIVQSAVARAADMLAPVPFDLPVVEVIRGLNSVSPPLPARILRLVNAYVSMVSPRAFRAALPHDAALDILRAKATPADAPAIAAIAQSMETDAGRSALEASSR